MPWSARDQCEISHISSMHPDITISGLLLPSDDLPLQLPSPQRHNGPDRFDQTKRPGALQKAVSRTERAGHGEQQNEPMAAIFQGVTDQHRRDGEQAE